MKEEFYFDTLNHKRGMKLAEDKNYFAYRSGGFLYFDYVGTEYKLTSDVKAKRAGWKFHISIDDSIAADGTQPNLERGWNTVMGIFYDNRIYRAKVVRNGVEMAREPSSERTDLGVHISPNRGKQITIYTFFHSAQDWTGIISAITAGLNEAGVNPSYLSIADKEVNCYISYRNDRKPEVAATNKEAYLSEIEAVEMSYLHPEQVVFNPAGDDDPFVGLTVSYPARTRPILVDSGFRPYHDISQIALVP